MVKDPLRVFRICRFASTLSFTPAPELIKEGQSLSQEQLDLIAGERITLELNKILLKSQAPALGFEWLHKLNIIERLFPHWNIEPCMQALNNGALVKLPYPQKLTLMWSIALSHTSCAAQEDILNKLLLHTVERYPLRTFVLKGTPLWPQLKRICTQKELFVLAEELQLELLCHIASSFNHSNAKLNLDKAIELNVAQNPLPALLQGRHFRRGRTLHHLHLVCW